MKFNATCRRNGAAIPFHPQDGRLAGLAYFILRFKKIAMVPRIRVGKPATNTGVVLIGISISIGAIGITEIEIAI